ncbi:MAG: FAD:protein FMN transferase [Acidobacteriota bacterium]
MKFPRASRRPYSRRGFLGAGSLLSRGGPTAPRLIRTSRPAMACQFEILIHAADRSRMMVLHHAFDEIDRLEAQMTVYQEESEIAAINRKAASGPVAVERHLFRLLMLGAQLSRQTGGAFDMTSGPLSRCWGFRDRRGRLPSRQEIEQTRRRVGSQWVAFNEAEGTLCFRRPLELNLGGIGKGYALDRAARLLKDAGLEHFLLHGGHSSILAAGRAFSGGGWPVGVRHPQSPHTDFALLRLCGQAMSTSGIGEQSFSANGRAYGHVIDPRTGYPVRHHLSATAVASTAARADALSTAFFVMDVTEIKAFCQAHLETGALLLSGDPPRVRRFGLKPEQVEIYC